MPRYYSMPALLTRTCGGFAGHVVEWLKLKWQDSYFQRIPLLSDDLFVNQRLLIHYVIDHHSGIGYWEIYRKPLRHPMMMDAITKEQPFFNLWWAMDLSRIDLLRIFWGGEGQWLVYSDVDPLGPVQGARSLRKPGVYSLEEALHKQVAAGDATLSLLHPQILNDIASALSETKGAMNVEAGPPEFENLAGHYATVYSTPDLMDYQLVFIEDLRWLSLTHQPLLLHTSGKPEALLDRYNLSWYMDFAV